LHRKLRLPECPVREEISHSINHEHMPKSQETRAALEDVGSRRSDFEQRCAEVGGDIETPEAKESPTTVTGKVITYR
jgi:hypothetical protein